MKFDHAAMHLFHIHPLLYSRFLVYVFGIWPDSRSLLIDFQNFLNTIIPGIKVTLTIRSQIIDFLDAQIYTNITRMAAVFFTPRSSSNQPTPTNFFTVLHFTLHTHSHLSQDVNLSVSKEFPLPSMITDKLHLPSLKYFVPVVTAYPNYSN